jgi:hypothetical protein
MVTRWEAFLPTIDGLVSFKPGEIPHHFPKDTLVIESIEADQVEYLQDQPVIIPYNHTNVTVHFAGAWWSQPYNQYISYMLEGLHNRFQVCDMGQPRDWPTETWSICFCHSEAMWIWAPGLCILQVAFHD